MKIAIMGYAGSGKTYLSEYISTKKSIPTLHLDTIKYDLDWKPVDDDTALRQVSEFMQKGSWIIEGNYEKMLQSERLEAADQIIFVLLPPLTCLFRAIKRTKNRQAEGYKNDMNLFFIRFVLFGCRTKARRQHYAEIIEKYKDKTVVLKSQKQIDKFMESV
ncbi:MAG: DNA topology modulation protein FlaR [Oscillospiraceae bacterium]|nr:DNA topology modulation protein FlaR [Oscillospiraceae bacterium]